MSTPVGGASAASFIAAEAAPTVIVRSPDTSGYAQQMYRNVQERDEPRGRRFSGEPLSRLKSLPLGGELPLL